VGYSIELLSGEGAEAEAQHAQAAEGEPEAKLEVRAVDTLR
jgi:hypothetical protein